MRLLIKILIVVFILVVVFVISIPASVLDNNLAKATKEQWRLAETSGTIWKGSGMLLRKPNTVIAPINWRFEPSALLQGAARWRLESGQATPGIDAVLTIRKGGVEIEGLNFSTQATTLYSFLPKEVVQAVDGRLTIHSPSLSLNNKNQVGNINGDWSNAQITLYNTPVSLGDVSFNMDSGEQGQSGNIRNQGGMLQLEGQFSSDAGDSRRKGNLKITPRASASPEVMQLLSTLGQPDASGAYVLEMR